MQKIKTILLVAVAAILVAASVVQYHHHDAHGNICFTLFADAGSHHHDHDNPDSHHDCGAKISTVNITDEQSSKHIFDVQSCNMPYHVSEKEMLCVAELELGKYTVGAYVVFRILSAPFLRACSFRAPPVSL